MKKAPAGDNGGSLLAFSTFLEGEPRNRRIFRCRELVAGIKDDFVARRERKTLTPLR
jgi:hypothetical protein